MSTAAILGLLGSNLLIALGGVLLMWLLCLRARDPTPMDAFWAFGLFLLAAATFLRLDHGGTRGLLLLALCGAWALRLGSYLLLRWRRHGADPRYAAMMRNAKERRGWDYPQASLRLVFLTQAPLLWLVSLPVQLGQLDAGAPGALAQFGALLAAAGIVFESVADAQLTRFRADPANRGLVMDRGLWRYTRHPNYFGDACVWWGLWLIAAETPAGVFALPGPLFLTWTLLRWSGADLLERKLGRSKPGYAAYAARTSKFLPWFPRG